MRSSVVSGRRFLRPVLGIMAVLSLAGLGLAAGVQASGAEQDQVDSANVSPIPSASPSVVPSPSASPSPSVSASPSSSAAPEQQTTPSSLATPSPLAGAGHPASRARGNHTVTFSSVAGTQGMPSGQTVADGKPATLPHDNPTRAGWTFNGWFQGDVAYDFSKPVTGDVTLTAKWGGSFSTSPTEGPHLGGTDVTVATPTDQVRLAQVSTGNGFSLAVGSDGNAYAWGDNEYGQLGDGTTTQRNITQMVAMPEGIRIAQVSAGGDYAMALDLDGKIWTWGHNQWYGNLGQGSSTEGAISTPGLVAAPEDVTFTAIAASTAHSLALDQNGRIWSWGAAGQIARSTQKYRQQTPGLVEENIPSEGIVFTAISAGKAHSIALTADGVAWTWGDFSNALGTDRVPNDDGIYPRFPPAPVVTDLRFTAVSAGDRHSTAIAEDGTIWTWGDTANGRLGHTTDKDNPADRPGRVPGLTGATGVSAGAGRTVAVTDTGVWTWGSNDRGQLGNGTTQDAVAPVQVSTPGKVPAGFGYISIPSGSAGTHTLLVGTDGNTYAHGDNTYGQLGYNTANKTANPLPGMVWQVANTQLTDLPFDESRNSAGPYRKADGWHVTAPRHGLGTASLTIKSTIDRVAQPDDTSQRFTYTGRTATVTFKTEHGSSTPAQRVVVGDTVRFPDDPTSDGWTFNGWFQGDLPYDFSKPLTGDVTLTARWGQRVTTPNEGPWRGGSDVHLASPTAPVRFAQVSTGLHHSLALGSDGNAYGWGANYSGQVGDGTTAHRLTPVMVAMPEGVKFTQVQAGYWHSVALDRDGRVWTWGNNQQFQQGRPKDDNHPYERPGLIDVPADVRFIAIGVGMSHTLALDQDGNIWSWGLNGNRQLGRYLSWDGRGWGYTAEKVLIPEAAFTTVGGADSHSMALTTDGTAWTWGADDNMSAHPMDPDAVLGHVGTGPAPVDTRLRFTALAGGCFQTIGIGRDGNVYTWGDEPKAALARTTDATNPANRPGRVPDLSGATEIGGSGGKSMVLTSTGVWAWGDNQYGELGTDTNIGRDEPPVSNPIRVPIPKGTPKGFKYARLFTMSGGCDHTLIIGSDGDAYAFGENDRGQLGINTDGDDSYDERRHIDPVMVWRPVDGRITSVLFGPKTNLGDMRRRPDGWHAYSPRHRPETVPLTIRTLPGVQGDDDYEESQHVEDTSQQFTYTGDMATLTFTTPHGHAPDPQQVPVGEPTQRPDDPSEDGWTFDGWFDGDVAYDFTRPLEHDLTLTGRWHRTGRWVLSPDHGSEYGDETLTLTAPAAPGIRLASVDTSGSSALGIGSDGNLYAWGDNTYGQLGDGTLTRRTSPVLIPRPDGTGDEFTWVKAASGRTHSTAVGSDGNLYIWGSLPSGLGDRNYSTSSTRPVKVRTPADAEDPEFTWASTAAGDGFVIGLGSDGTMYTWGTMPEGLGDPYGSTKSDIPLLVHVPKGAPPAFRYEQIAAGDRHALAIGSDGNLYTWGSNTHGQLGHADTDANVDEDDEDEDTGTPIAAAAPDPQQPTGYVQASAGGDHTLAIDQQGRLWAWGTLADGTDTTTPVRIQPAGTADTYRFTHTSTGRAHYTATGQDHRTWTWGDNTNGQAGHDTSTPLQPTVVPGLRTTVTIAGDDTTIAIDTNGDTQAWGDNTNGQTGHGATDPTPTPHKATVPPQPTPTSLTIDNVTLSLRRTGPNTWQVTTTAHDPGPVPVRVRWTLAGQDQPDDTTNTYTYRHTGILPNAGGTGIILLIIAGMLTLAITNANRHRHTPPTTTNTSPE